MLIAFVLADTASTTNRTRSGVDLRISLGAVEKTEFLFMSVFEPLIRLNFCRVTNGLSETSTVSLVAADTDTREEE
jgi:hypothetical protein